MKAYVFRCSLAAAAFAGGLCSSGNARGSGFDVPYIGSAQSGPSTRDAAAVYWNPAQLAFLERTELFAGAGLVIGHASYGRERFGAYQTPESLELRLPISEAHMAPEKTGTTTSVSTTPVAPTGDLFFALPILPKRLVLGAGLYVPYAAALDFPDDGPQRYQLDDVLFVAANLTVSAGLKLDKRLSIGAGISYVLGYAELSKIVDFAAVPELGRALASPRIGQENELGPSAPTDLRELDVLSFSVGVAIGRTTSAATS